MYDDKHATTELRPIVFKLTCQFWWLCGFVDGFCLNRLVGHLSVIDRKNVTFGTAAVTLRCSGVWPLKARMPLFASLSISNFLHPTEKERLWKYLLPSACYCGFQLTMWCNCQSCLLCQMWPTSHCLCFDLFWKRKNIFTTRILSGPACFRL